MFVELGVSRKVLRFQKNVPFCIRMKLRPFEIFCKEAERQGHAGEIQLQVPVMCDSHQKLNPESPTSEMGALTPQVIAHQEFHGESEEPFHPSRPFPPKIFGFDKSALSNKKSFVKKLPARFSCLYSEVLYKWYVIKG